MVAPTVSYFARVGIDVDQASLAKVDQYFAAIEKKMANYKGATGAGLKIRASFDVSSRATQRNLKEQLATISEKLSIKITKVTLGVTKLSLKEQLDKKIGENGLRVQLAPWVTAKSLLDLRKALRASLADIPVTVKYSGNFRETLMNRINYAIAPAKRGRSGGGSGSPLGGSRSGSGGGGGSSGYGFPGNLMMGPTGRLLRMGAAAVPFVGGAIGLGNLNKANTDYQSQKIAAEGVFENYGGGQAALDQLFALSQKRGIDFKKALPQFTQFMASAMPAMGYGTSFQTFQGFLEFGRARGATAESMERALYAVSQMAGKGKISSEELNQQLGDAAGFGEMKAIFAQAYAQQTKSGLTGQKAIADLVDAMKKGKVLSSDILPIVAQIASGRVAGVIDKASQSADANQNRYNNARNAFMAKFSENGGEAALSKMWTSLTKLMEELGKRAPALANAFSDLIDKFVSLTKVITDLWSLWDTGAGNGTTIGVKNATGINLVSVRDAMKSLTDMLGKLTEGIGFTYTAIGALLTYHLAKFGISFVKGKLSGGLATATNGAVGTLGMAAFAQATALGQAIRVWVVNSTNQANKAPGAVAVPGAGGTPQGTGWKSKVGGFLGKWGAGIAGLGGLAMSLFSDNARVQAIGNILGTAGMGASLGSFVPLPGAAIVGGALGAGLGVWQNADTLFGSTVTPPSDIAAAAPMVNQARDTTNTFNNVSDIKLQADIKITAQDGTEAYSQFQKELNSQMESAILGHLRGAQSTWADYAR